MAAFTPRGFAEAWKQRVGKVEPEIRGLVQRTGRRLLVASKRHMLQQIYSIPEDMTASGKKKWVRTMNLLNAEKLEYAPDGSAVTLTNEMIYARARHELGRDGRQTKRPAHWREGIYAETLEEVHRDMVDTRYRIFKASGG